MQVGILGVVCTTTIRRSMRSKGTPLKLNTRDTLYASHQQERYHESHENLEVSAD
jgi:hypothetical protein